MKIHLHDEQFDGYLHAACQRVKNEDRAHIMGEEAFSVQPRSKRCVYCTRINWPKGFGDPV